MRHFVHRSHWVEVNDIERYIPYGEHQNDHWHFVPPNRIHFGMIISIRLIRIAIATAFIAEFRASKYRIELTEIDMAN